MRPVEKQSARGEIQSLRNASKMGVPIAQCSATNRRGLRCGNPAILGGSVCPLHGGSAPQVREAAKKRLMQLVPDSIEAMAELAGVVGDADGAEDEKVKQRALADILDRAGLRPADQVVVTEQSVPNEELDRLIVEAMRVRGMAPPEDVSDAEVVPENGTPELEQGPDGS